MKSINHTASTSTTSTSTSTSTSTTSTSTTTQIDCALNINGGILEWENIGDVCFM